MMTETNRDKQGEPRLLREAELEAVAGGEAGTAASIHVAAVVYWWLLDRAEPPVPTP